MGDIRHARDKIIVAPVSHWRKSLVPPQNPGLQSLLVMPRCLIGAKYLAVSMYDRFSRPKPFLKGSIYF